MKSNILSALLIVLLIVLGSCSGGEHVAQNGAYYGGGIGLGSIIAVVISWSRNKSIIWAIIHGLLGWLYVIYALIVGDKG